MPTISIQAVKDELGEDVANALFEKFPGCQLNIPKKPSSMLYGGDLEKRNRSIYNRFTVSGQTYEEIAEDLGLDERTVRRIVADNLHKKKK